ncbi:hypothetical protein COL68_29935 [Bacillus wiedmannii]|nr:hypothetical protein CN672_27300 [Bacillus wiedmannii]PEM05798.1 hypothetical protein CN610_28320 [Bacillus wiedmannii]PFZ48971.1 hypothetical protein COL68_29935 [Bacillus wiedmannii]PGD92713.1 hypothetical protein COM48_19965 [Bacillus wiedmannii]
MIMKFSRVSQVSELTGLHPISLRRMLVEHATIQKNKSFMQCLSYKCEKYGIAYVKADKWFASSKICSCCGVKYDHSVQPEGQWSLKIREWRCASCNSHHDRDVNAAINLSRWVK